MNTLLDTEKLGIKTFVVTYEDSTKEIVKPVSWKFLDDVQILQYSILEASAATGGSIAELLNHKNSDFWEPATKLAALMPIVGKDEKGINLDKIEDCEELIRIFVTTTTHRDQDTGLISPGPEGFLLPSEISKINGVNFLRLLTRIQQKIQEQMKKS